MDPSRPVVHYLDAPTAPAIPASGWLAMRLYGQPPWRPRAVPAPCVRWWSPPLAGPVIAYVVASALGIERPRVDFDHPTLRDWIRARYELENGRLVEARRLARRVVADWPDWAPGWVLLEAVAHQIPGDSQTEAYRRGRGRHTDCGFAMGCGPFEMTMKPSPIAKMLQ
ncbi:MAG: hypothetical protein AAGA48_08615 [Myxococcota bacterium]